MNSPKDGIEVSVIIGFKDWGLDRLELSIRALKEALSELDGEVIIADYGSSDPASNQAVVESAGAKYLYVDGDGVWSRSRALNAGVAASSGRVLITTDADMLFSPGSIAEIVTELIADPFQAIVLQCRDLPAKYDSVGVRSAGLQWTEFEATSHFRPRWGMGGMMAVRREAFLEIRGFDERMEIYGGEDMDFAVRIQRTGRRLKWIDKTSVRMYHMWHPSSRSATDTSDVQKAAVKKNSAIVSDDKSYIRNVTSWKHKPVDAPLLVSVVICTRNRANFLADSIYSVLGQTTQDLELIIIDDGSDDDTRELVESIDDPRIRYVYQEKKGLAAGRNVATRLAAGRYIVIHDDDDIMVPDRIERHFEALEGGIQGTYGGWIDFKDGDPKDFKTNPGKPFVNDIVQFVGEVFVHATLMLPTALMKQVAYDESLRSGSDYSLAVRLSRSGIKLKHFGHYAILRRLHPHQVTHADASFQRSSWAFTKSLGMHNLSPAQVKFMRGAVDQKFVEILPKSKVPAFMNVALPDAMALRYVVIPLSSGITLDQELMDNARSNISVVFDEEGAPIALSGSIRDVTLRDLYLLRRDRIPFELKTVPWDNSIIEKGLSVDEFIVGELQGSVSGSDSILLLAECDSSPDALEGNAEPLQRFFRVERQSATRWIYAFEYPNYSLAVEASMVFSVSQKAEISLLSKSSILNRLDTFSPESL